MFHNEREFTDHVVTALGTQGYTVLREIPVRSRQRLDILAVKDGIRKGIEVKFTARGLLDDITKAHGILTLPEVDEMYVCGPKVFMSENVRTFAEHVGIGLLAATDSGELEWLGKGRSLVPARLLLGGGYGSVVQAGGDAVYNANIRNDGQKTAVDLKAFMLPAGPFIARPKSRSIARRDRLAGGETWEVTVACRVKRDTLPG